MTLDFTSSNSEDRWKGGGSANFTYAGAAASVDVAATYGHSQSTIGSNAAATVTAHFNGACVQNLVNGWLADLQRKAAAGLSEVGKEQVTRNAALTGTVPEPKPPDLAKPNSDPKVTDKIGKISSLEGLEAYAKAAAYDKYKKDGGTKDLGGFLDEAKQPTNAGAAISKAAASRIVIDDDLDDADEDSTREVIDAEARFEAFAKVTDQAADKDDGKPPQRPGDFSAFEPMGVWIADWSQLFPWICSAYCNDIPGDTRRELIRLKTLQQDCITLAKLYARFAVCVPVMGMDVNFQDVSNSFSHGAASISDFLKASGSNPGSPASIDAFIKATVGHLGSSAQAMTRSGTRTVICARPSSVSG